MLERFIEEANRVNSPDAVSKLFGNALGVLGYDRFCYSLITDHPSLGLKAGHAVVSNYPDDWMAHYKTNQYEKKDPVPHFGSSASRPFTWESLFQTYELRTDQKKVMNEANDAKLLDGIAVPICGHNGELAGVGMASSVGGIRPDKTLLSKIHALSLQFHLVYTELKQKDWLESSAGRPVRLTTREKEILSWAAEGKSDFTIADILGVSHSAIRFHMNNIFKKLNANERTLATVKAIRQGLILPTYLR